MNQRTVTVHTEEDGTVHMLIPSRINQMRHSEEDFQNWQYLYFEQQNMQAYEAIPYAYGTLNQAAA